MASRPDDNGIAYVDSVHQRSAHSHVHLRSTGECVHREAGELCPSWRERAEAAEAKVARVTELLFRHYTGSPGFEKTPEYVLEVDALADLYDDELAADLLAALGGRP